MNNCLTFEYVKNVVTSMVVIIHSNCEHVRIMLKSICIVILFAQLVTCASLANHLYDQYLPLPRSTVYCGELRKQFADGYIQLKDFIDQIRSCKEESADETNNNDVTDTTSKKQTIDSATYTYTDYLLPVMRNSVPSQVQTNTASNVNTNPTMYSAFQSPIIPVPTATTMQKDDTVILRGIPTTSQSLQFKQLVTQNQHENSLPPVTNNVVENQRFSVSTPSHSPYANFYRPTIGFYNLKTTAGNLAVNWSEYLQYRNILKNLGYDKNSIRSPTYQTNSLRQVENFIHTNQNLPQVASVVSTTKSAAEALQRINADLKDDVSLLNENEGGSNQLTLSYYESFAPQIIESIASRSKIDRGKELYNNEMDSSQIKMNPKNVALRKHVVKDESTTVNDDNNAAKDILDIKYSQLEDKLVSDLKRRQAILQKLEQESMVEHFAKPTGISVVKLSDVFKRINEETVMKSLAGLKNEQADIKPIDNWKINPSSNYRPMTISKGPTVKRSYSATSGAVRYKTVNPKYVFPQQVSTGNIVTNQGSRVFPFPVERNLQNDLEFRSQTYSNNPVHRTDILPIYQSNIMNNNDTSKLKQTFVFTPTIAWHNNQNVSKQHVQSFQGSSKLILPKLLISNNLISNHNLSTWNNFAYHLNEIKPQHSRDDIATRKNIIPQEEFQERKHESFSRSILFTNKFYNDVIRAAMRRKKSMFDEANNIVKKSDIFTLMERPRRRKFSLSSLKYGLQNGNVLE